YDVTSFQISIPLFCPLDGYFEDGPNSGQNNGMDIWNEVTSPHSPVGGTGRPSSIGVYPVRRLASQHETQSQAVLQLRIGAITVISGDFLESYVSQYKLGQKSEEEAQNVVVVNGNS